MRKTKKRRQRTNKRKRFLIANAFLALFLFLGIGYSALSTNLNILGNIQLKKYDPNIYWALQDNDNDGVKETLILSSEEVTGQEQGNFFKHTVFHYREEVPWIAGNFASSTNNKSYNIILIFIITI